MQDIEFDYEAPIYRVEKCNVYAGCVMKYWKNKRTPCRKILFSMNEDGTVNDLLYDSPNYSMDESQKFYVADVVNLEKLLSHFNYRTRLVDREIKDIFNFFISKNGKFYEKDPRKLPVSLEEYINLNIISELGKKPTKDEKKEVEKFKTKVKTYTFR